MTASGPDLLKGGYRPCWMLILRTETPNHDPACSECGLSGQGCPPMQYLNGLFVVHNPALNDCMAPLDRCVSEQARTSTKLR